MLLSVVTRRYLMHTQYTLCASLTMKDGIIDIAVQIFKCNLMTGFKLRLCFGLGQEPVTEE